MDTRHLVSLSYDQMLEYVLNHYIKHNGQEKAAKLVRKVYSSDSLSGLISRSRLFSFAIEAKHIVGKVNAIPFFLFSNGDTLLTASMVVLERWNSEVNENYRIASDEELKNMAVDIVNYMHDLM